jgi:hypothetical protein
MLVSNKNKNRLLWKTEMTNIKIKVKRKRKKNINRRETRCQKRACVVVGRWIAETNPTTSRKHVGDYHTPPHTLPKNGRAYVTRVCAIIFFLLIFYIY